MRAVLWISILYLTVVLTVAHAQQSASFKLKESTLNSGGNPANGTSPTSASFTISHDALGDEIGYRAITGPSFRMDPGFVATYRPAGEVVGLIFPDAQTLSWNAERAAAGYSMYRDLLSSLSGLGYGNCLETDISSTTTTDLAIPPLSDGYFYLVASRNRIDDEGTKGIDSAGSERPNLTPCP